jgi:hypothetical protein
MRTIEEIKKEAFFLDKYMTVTDKGYSPTALIELVNEAYELGRSESVPLVWVANYGDGSEHIEFSKISKNLFYYVKRNWQSETSFCGLFTYVEKQNQPHVIVEIDINCKNVEKAKLLCQSHYDRMSGRGK